MDDKANGRLLIDNPVPNANRFQKTNNKRSGSENIFYLLSFCFDPSSYKQDIEQETKCC